MKIKCCPSKQQNERTERISLLLSSYVYGPETESSMPVLLRPLLF